MLFDQEARHFIYSPILVRVSAAEACIDSSLFFQIVPSWSSLNFSAPIAVRQPIHIAITKCVYISITEYLSFLVWPTDLKKTPQSLDLSKNRDVIVRKSVLP